MNKPKFNLPGIQELKTNEIEEYQGGLFTLAAIIGITSMLVITALHCYEYFYCKSHPEQYPPNDTNNSPC